jgi:acyl-CoA dehydrogenase
VKLASRSVVASVTAMVPNSLGPGELLVHYGTDEQKRYYLPRLASGAEIPCFALTEPEAGSDAAAARSTGIVCRGLWEGREVLGMRLTWNKRYITLSPVATVIGLAFRLSDPEHLLGDKDDLGITCALIPRAVPGVEVGRRHDPLGVPFMNGPTTGRDVFVPIDFIIGGRAMAGQGWRMLMESLAAGRSISLPALSAAVGQFCARAAGAYASVRQQFDMPIGRFEGIEEPLARIGGHAYLMNAVRTVTAGAVDAGQKPSVVSAIAKAYLTEGMRRVVNDAMDVFAGAGISRGPRNVMARPYLSVPIGITVEGANILTRSLIIYGQGAIRCHPYVRRVMASVTARDLAAFDRAFAGHAAFVLSSLVRSFVLGLTGGRFARPVRGPAGEYLGRLSRLSAAFVTLSDAAMATLGGDLKRREKISGRFADALAWMYVGSAVAKRFHDDGQPAADEAVMRWSSELAIHETQRALQGILDNLPNRMVAIALRPVVFPLGARYRPPGDALGGTVARGLLDGGESWHRLTRDIFVPDAREAGLGRLLWALGKVTASRSVEARVRTAVRARRLARASGDALLNGAVEAGVITETERQVVIDAAAAREEVIQVDAFATAAVGQASAAALEYAAR